MKQSVHTLWECTAAPLIVQLKFGKGRQQFTANMIKLHARIYMYIL